MPAELPTQDRSIDLIAPNGEPYSVRIPAPGDFDSFFLFSLHKAGSTMMDNIMRDICRHLELPAITIAADVFASNLAFDQLGHEIEQTLFHRGYAYPGFRQFFTFSPAFDFARHKKIFLVRDPRDMLTSLYFSLKHSHVIPSGGSEGKKIRTLNRQLHAADINSDWIFERANLLKERFRIYRAHIMDEHVKIYRYEDVVYAKREWIRDMLEFLGLQIENNTLAEIVSRYDLFPEEENPFEHIRQVKPGNHTKHLTPATIGRLNDLFAQELATYAY